MPGDNLAGEDCRRISAAMRLEKGHMSWYFKYIKYGNQCSLWWVKNDRNNSSNPWNPAPFWGPSLSERTDGIAHGLTTEQTRRLLCILVEHSLDHSQRARVLLLESV